MGQEYIFRVKEINSGKIWNEPAEVPDNTIPELYFQGLIKSWNKDFPDKQRELIEVVNKSDKRYCELEKVNMMTISKNNEMYDILHCKKCGIYIKRHTIETPTLICEPKKTCRDCNKIFKTEKGLLKHNKKGKHKIPDWLPDGV